MRVIDRLYEYLTSQRVSPYAFERNCGIANGYLKKQTKGKGSIGSEILEKINARYRDLSLIWLITGEGKMISGSYPEPAAPATFSEEQPPYSSQSHLIKLLQDQIAVLQNALADKQKIIRLLEQQSSAADKKQP